MTPEEAANDIVESMGNEATMPHLWAIKIQKAIIAAVEEDRKTRQHIFVGRRDRWCELCNQPDRDDIHIYSRETTRASVEYEREECAKILHEVYQAWVEGEHSPGEAFESAREKILHGARSNGGEK